MDILLWATENNINKQRVLNLKHGDEDFTFCSTRPTKTKLNDRVFFMDKGGIVYGFSAFEKYEFTKVKHNLEGQPQSGMAIFFIGPFVPLRNTLPREVWPIRRWRYVKGRVADYL